MKHFSQLSNPWPFPFHFAVLGRKMIKGIPALTMQIKKKLNH